MANARWMNFLIGLWPSALAIALARRGPPGDPRIGFVLVLWTAPAAGWCEMDYA
jgi:hypothetical protein